MNSRTDDETRDADDLLLGEAVRQLVAALRPERIYLFGSRARGDAREDSDYDLLIVMPEAEEPEYRLEQRAYGALWSIRLPLEIIVMSHQEFEEWTPAVASLPATVLREGHLLYAA
jgi:predicted nucleotidyltransferase